MLCENQASFLSGMGLGKVKTFHQREVKIMYSFCLMVEASDHGYVLHTRRIHVTRYNVVRVGYIYMFFFSNE
jgi:hypothetical protein